MGKRRGGGRERKRGGNIFKLWAAGLLFLLDHTMPFKLLTQWFRGSSCPLVNIVYSSFYGCMYGLASILLAFKMDGAEKILNVNERKALKSIVLYPIIYSNLVNMR